MKTIEYKRRFLKHMKILKIDYWLAVQELESSIECYGYTDDPENDAQQAVYTLLDCPG